MEVTVGATNPTIGRKEPAGWLELPFPPSRGRGLSDLLVTEVPEHHDNGIRTTAAREVR